MERRKGSGLKSRQELDYDFPRKGEGMAISHEMGKLGGLTNRRPGTLEKLTRLNKALRHEEPDRVPVSDFFWGSFIERWRRELNLPAMPIRMTTTISIGS